MTIPTMARLALALMLAAPPAWAASDPYAFVTGSVCVDAANRAVAGDPAHCPRHRKLKIGEPIPYRRVDAGNWQALTAYPVEGPGGEWRAMAEKVFGGNDTTGSYGDLGVRSGYDLLEVGEDFVSGIRTSDPGGGDQIFWRTAACDRTNGWIFFPPGLGPGERGQTRSTLKITKGPSTRCPRDQLGSIGPDFTTWERPAEPVRYTSGKLLDSIVSLHFAYGDPADRSHDDDSMEKFYFTREYGYSRWEAWQTPAGCARRTGAAGLDPVEACRLSPAEQCNGPNSATYFGKLYIRLDCRDSTFFVTDADRPFDPLVNDAAPGDVASRNRLANGTFADGASGWDASPAATPRREARSNNAVLALPPGGRLEQDFILPETGSGAAEALRWGATLAGDRGPATARVLLTIETDGAAPQTLERVVTLDGSAPQRLRFSAPAPGRTARGHFEVQFEGAAGGTVDDAFVALVPPDAP